MTSGLTTRGISGWFLLGLLLRLPGVFFNGQHDLYEIIFDWGVDVRTEGLVRGFSINYGVFSFAAFGAATYLAESLPRFWWLPLKILIIAFESGVLFALLRVAKRQTAGVILTAYWLNPWFVWHGAYQGFWEGPHVLAGLLGCLALRRWGSDWRGWTLLGACLFVSWQFKPQGLLHFAIPVGLLLVVSFRRLEQPALPWYSLGFGGMAVLVSGLFWIAGGSLFALLHNLRSSAEAMPLLSSGGLGIWRFVSYLYMKVHGIPGEVYQVRMPVLLVAYGTVASVGVCAAVLGALAVRLARSCERHRSPPWMAVYLMIAAGALVVSQFGARAHLNHTYGAMVLLIPLLANHRRLRVAWIVAVLVQGFAHVSRYQMGNASLLPPESVLERWGAGQLSGTVRGLDVVTSPDRWLRFQDTVNTVLGHLPGHEAFSILSVVMFVATIVMVAALFDLAQHPDQGPLESAAVR